MCGRPVGFKEGLAKSGGGSNAVMCPAFRCGAMTAGPCVDGPLGSRRDLQNLAAVRMQSCVRPFDAAL